MTVKTTAMTTNMEKTVVSRIPIGAYEISNRSRGQPTGSFDSPAASPTFRTDGSTIPKDPWSAHALLLPSDTHSPINSTSPLQLINNPMANDSRFVNFKYQAAPAHPMNFPENATTMMAMVYPHALPLSRRPRLVLRPERTKYCEESRREGWIRSRSAGLNAETMDSRWARRSIRSGLRACQ